MKIVISENGKSILAHATQTVVRLSTLLANVNLSRPMGKGTFLYINEEDYSRHPNPGSLMIDPGSTVEIYQRLTHVTNPDELVVCWPQKGSQPLHIKGHGCTTWDDLISTVPSLSWVQNAGPYVYSHVAMGGELDPDYVLENGDLISLTTTALGWDEGDPYDEEGPAGEAPFTLEDLYKEEEPVYGTVKRKAQNVWQGDILYMNGIYYEILAREERTDGLRFAYWNRPEGCSQSVLVKPGSLLVVRE